MAFNRRSEGLGGRLARGCPFSPGSARVASEGLKRRVKIACPGDLKFLGGQAIITTKK